MFKENDEVRNKRIRKRKAMRLYSTDSRSKWKAGLKAAVKHRGYGMFRGENQTDRYEDDSYNWLDDEAGDPVPRDPCPDYFMFNIITPSVK